MPSRIHTQSRSTRPQAKDARSHQPAPAINIYLNAGQQAGANRASDFTSTSRFHEAPSAAPAPAPAQAATGSQAAPRPPTSPQAAPRPPAPPAPLRQPPVAPTPVFTDGLRQSYVRAPYSAENDAWYKKHFGSHVLSPLPEIKQKIPEKDDVNLSYGFCHEMLRAFAYQYRRGHNLVEGSTVGSSLVNDASGTLRLLTIGTFKATSVSYRHARSQIWFCGHPKNEWLSLFEKNKAAVMRAERDVETLRQLHNELYELGDKKYQLSSDDIENVLHLQDRLAVYVVALLEDKGVFAEHAEWIPLSLFRLKVQNAERVDPIPARQGPSHESSPLSTEEQAKAAAMMQQAVSDPAKRVGSTILVKLGASAQRLGMGMSAAASGALVLTLISRAVAKKGDKYNNIHWKDRKQQEKGMKRMQGMLKSRARVDLGFVIFMAHELVGNLQAASKCPELARLMRKRLHQMTGLMLDYIDTSTKSVQQAKFKKEIIE